MINFLLFFRFFPFIFAQAWNKQKIQSNLTV